MTTRNNVKMDTVATDSFTYILVRQHNIYNVKKLFITLK